MARVNRSILGAFGFLLGALTASPSRASDAPAVLLRGPEDGGMGSDASGDAGALMRLAGQAWNDGALPRARSLIDEAIAVSRARQGPGNPFLVGALFQRANWAWASGDRVAVEKDLQELRAMNPQSLEGLRSIARLLQVMERYSEALPVSEAALRMAPGYSRNVLLHGAVLLGLGRMEEAIAELRRAYEMDPTRFMPLVNAYRQEGRYEEARAILDAARRRDPASVAIPITTGYIDLYKLGFHKAEPIFRRTIEENPAEPMAHHHYGRVLEIAGREQEAFREYEDALRLHRRQGLRNVPEYIHTLYSVSEFHRRRGDVADQERALAEAERHAPLCSRYWVWALAELGNLHSRQPGREAAAERSLRGALDLCASREGSEDGLALLQVELARLALAKKDDATARRLADEAFESLRRHGLPSALLLFDCHAQIDLSERVAEIYSDLRLEDLSDKAYEKALEIVDCAPSVDLWRADLYLQLGRQRLLSGRADYAAERFRAARKIYAVVENAAGVADVEGLIRQAEAKGATAAGP